MGLNVRLNVRLAVALRVSDLESVSDALRGADEDIVRVRSAELDRLCVRVRVGGKDCVAVTSKDADFDGEVL